MEAFNIEIITNFPQCSQLARGSLAATQGLGCLFIETSGIVRPRHFSKSHLKEAEVF